MTSQEKEQCTEVHNIEFINTQQCKFSVFTFISPQFKFSVHLCVLIKLCYIILSKISIFISCCPWTEACMILALTSHPFACFLISGYLLWTPDNLKFFQFPLKVQFIGSWLCVQIPIFTIWLNDFSHVNGLKALLSESVVYVNDVMILQFDFLHLLHFTILRNLPGNVDLKSGQCFCKKTNKQMDYNFFSVYTLITHKKMTS